MKKQILLIVLILTVNLIILSGEKGYAQEIISSSGEHAETQDVKLSWTLGEPVIETISSNSNTLTQGFQQTKLVVTPVVTTDLNNDVLVYPNPATALINIHIKGFLKLNAIAGLYSLDGKLLRQKSLISENNFLKLKELPNGNYLLKITKDTEPFQTFKLVKTN